MSTTPRPEQPSPAALARYLAGDCTGEERQSIEHWLSASADHRAQLDTIDTLWSTRSEELRWDVEGMWTGLRGTMQADATRRAQRIRPDDARQRLRPVSDTVHTLSKRLYARRPIQWAAAAAAIVVSAGSIAMFGKHIPHQQSATTTAPMREYVTTRGQRATIQLSDGTRLVLAAQSRLRIPGDFGHGTREVFLEGEAAFTVVHDTARPFRVHAKEAVAEDIGTRFDFHAYANDSVVTVAVAEGAVALGRRPAPGRPDLLRTTSVAEGVVLRPGDIGILGANGQVATITDPAVERRLTWTTGQLAFTNAPLPDVLRAIGRWYDVDLRVRGAALASRTVTATFSVQSVGQMAEALALAVDGRVERHGRVLTLSEKSP